MRLRIIISIAAVLLGALHIFLPRISIDAVTLVLALVAIIPWVTPLVKSVELPGGFKIELQEVKEATQKVITGSANITGSASLTTSATEVKAKGFAEQNQKTVEWLKHIAENDANLALVGAAIEVQKRLFQLADNRGLKTQRLSLGQLLNELERTQTLPSEMRVGLRDLAGLRNQAVHGAPVSSEAADWVLKTLPSMLESIDRLSESSE